MLIQIPIGNDHIIGETNFVSRCETYYTIKLEHYVYTTPKTYVHNSHTTIPRICENHKLKDRNCLVVA